MASQSNVPILGILSILTLVLPVQADEPLPLKEQLNANALFHVSVRVELDGSLTLPPEKGAVSGKVLTITGKSSIDYGERLLHVDKTGKVPKTVRSYERMDFERKVGDQLQKVSLRPEVARMVILRHQQMEVPFSPDGPLTWGEIDLVRTDVFTPALSGLLPTKSVVPGDRWSASTSAIIELTDFAEIDQGSIACKFEQITELGGKKHARVSFQGTVEGTSEDGQSKQHLDGYFYFHLEGNYISYISMKGTQFLINEDGKTVGKIQGNFVLTRHAVAAIKGLSDADLDKLTLEPNDNNTLLLFDDPQFGLRFQYPRRWHVAGIKGPQLGLDEKGGSGLLLTRESLKQLPTAMQFVKETQQWWQKQKATVLGISPITVLQQSPSHIEHFLMEVKTGPQKFRMYYLIIRQNQGGAVIAARLQAGNVTALQNEVQKIAKSIQVTGK